MRMDITRRTEKKIKRQIYTPNPAILEIGCGTGRMTSLLSQQQARLIALDVDMEAVTTTQAKCENAHGLIGSGQQMPFKNQFFDHILFSLSLHHQKANQALTESCRVLRDGGSIIVLEPVFGAEFEDICLFFEDERDARLQALYGVISSELTMTHSEIFSTIWRFENKDELYQWLFDYYAIPWDDNSIQGMNRLLGEKVHHQPLDIEEKLIMIVLTPNHGSLPKKE